MTGISVWKKNIIPLTGTPYAQTYIWNTVPQPLTRDGTSNPTTKVPALTSMSITTITLEQMATTLAGNCVP